MALGDLEGAVTADEPLRASKVRARAGKIAPGGYRLPGSVSAGAAGDLFANLIAWAPWEPPTS